MQICVSATERRSDGFKTNLRNLRVPLVLRRRICRLCTKVHALLVRKSPCRPINWRMSFPQKIMSL